MLKTRWLRRPDAGSAEDEALYKTLLQRLIDVFLESRDVVLLQSLDGVLSLHDPADHPRLAECGQRMLDHGDRYLRNRGELMNEANQRHTPHPTSLTVFSQESFATSHRDDHQDGR